MSTLVRPLSGTIEELQYRVTTMSHGEPAMRTLLVSVAGSYWHPSRRIEGGSLIEMIVAAALANPHGTGQALIVDLSELEYTGSDRLLRRRRLAAKVVQVPYPYAVVASAQNFDHILDKNRARVAQAGQAQRCNEQNSGPNH